MAVADRFDNAHEIIFEHNVIRPAGTAPSWGNNIDNVRDTRPILASLCCSSEL